MCTRDRQAECWVEGIALGVPMVCTTTSVVEGRVYSLRKGGQEMTRLGQLERAVMEALWDKSASSPSSTFTVLRSHALSPTMPTRPCLPCSTA